MAAPTQIGLSTYPALRQPSHTRFFLFLTAAGLLNTLIAAFFFLRLPADHHPSLTYLTLRATLYVLIGALAGTLGSWFYWRRPASPFRLNPPIPFRHFALACASAWVWVPAIILFSRQDSPLTCVFSVLAAALLAAILRKLIPPAAPPVAPKLSHLPALFSDALTTPARRPQGYILSLILYAAAAELGNGYILDAATLLAAFAFLFAWCTTLEPAATTAVAPAAPAPASTHRRPTLRAVRRLAIVTVPAILVTLYSLLAGIEHRNAAEAAALAAFSGPNSGSGEQDKPQTRPSGTGFPGFESIILWPVPHKKEILPPLPQPDNILAPGTTKPLVIQFDGPYFYFEPPRKSPSPNALQATGTPLAHDLESNNFSPLIMEAHQALGTAIQVNRCRELWLSVLNADNRPGAIHIDVLLSNSANLQNQLLLYRQPILSSEAPNFTTKATPAQETLRFQVPASAKLRSFDHITVMFFPDEANYDKGPKVAIQQFQLIPR